MENNIEDKVVVITGASSGIGEATAVMLAERGAKVVFGARGLNRLEALARRIMGAGGEVAYAQTDVRRREDLTSLVKLALDRYDQLDVLINNAGIMPVSPLDDLRVEDWENMIDVNIKGVLYGIAAAWPVFRRQGFGHFVNSASTAGHNTMPNQSVYSGTKFALRASPRACGWRPAKTARDDHFAWLRQHELRRIHEKSGGENAARKRARQDGDSARCDRPRHRVRDRAAGQC